MEDGSIAGVEVHAGEDDVEMLDAETLDAAAAVSPPRDSAGVGGSATGDGGQGGNNKRKRNKKKNRRRNNRPSDPNNIADINRFVIDTCKRLKEKKSYLVWTAIGCLGASTLSDLVNEVVAIEKCGGQMTVDGRRFRTGGGILWNILKTREPKAYKEIMAKGKEFEKQLRRPKCVNTNNKQEMVKSRNEDKNSETSSLVREEEEEIELLDANEPLNNDHDDVDQKEIEGENKSGDKNERKSVRERMRVPVSYDDLFEEGEIPE